MHIQTELNWTTITKNSTVRESQRLYVIYKASFALTLSVPSLYTALLRGYCHYHVSTFYLLYLCCVYPHYHHDGSKVGCSQQHLQVFGHLQQKYSDIDCSVGMWVDLRNCFANNLFINYVRLEYSCFVVGEHSTVKEKLRQSKIHHPVVLSDDWFNSLVHQCVILIRKFKKHPLKTKHNE